jgi:hypothetical protein
MRLKNVCRFQQVRIPIELCERCFPRVLIQTRVRDTKTLFGTSSDLLVATAGESNCDSRHCFCGDNCPPRLSPTQSEKRSMKPFPILVFVCCLLSSARSQDAAQQPVQVFILAGQSNMQGQGVVDLDHPKYYNSGKGILKNVMKNPKRAKQYAHIQDVVQASHQKRNQIRTAFDWFYELRWQTIISALNFNSAICWEMRLRSKSC